MALKTRITSHDGFVAIRLVERNIQSGVADFPDERTWPFDFFYDDEKLVRGVRELVGIEVLDVSLVTEDWLAELDELDLPRVDVPEADLFDSLISDVLRWARETYPSRNEQATG
jgi:hypothetical protein